MAKYCVIQVETDMLYSVSDKYGPIITGSSLSMLDSEILIGM